VLLVDDHVCRAAPDGDFRSFAHRYIHPRIGHGEHDLDAGITQDRSNRAGYFPSRSRIRYLTVVHTLQSMTDSARLSDPLGGVPAVVPRIRTRRVGVRQRQDVLALRSGDGLDEIARQERVGLDARSRPGGGAAFGAGSTPSS